MSIAAIPTTYRDINFRSRLEARWAAFFDEIGWQYTYEPFDAEGYIPDFLIHGEWPLLVEVKPAVTLADYQAPINKMIEGVYHDWQHDVLIVGADPLPKRFSGLAVGDNHPFAGLLGDRYTECSEHRRFCISDQDTCKQEPVWHFDAGNWFCCEICKEAAVYNAQYNYRGRPCGHYLGNDHLGNISRRWIESKWALATNETQWAARPRRR